MHWQFTAQIYKTFDKILSTVCQILFISQEFECFLGRYFLLQTYLQSYFTNVSMRKENKIINMSNKNLTY